ncbi:solute carrier organic anion transporter family member 4A1 isoform X6 [Hylobates moloch]|uniref:solute carrier organic anion transporter family member 4A1 isoform X6 n=1 Tax=Hylobates moloch TaxID=81572 RepID=UPI001363E73C|nr:solute carrier organic anion transporter family member 4A1 isoform X6 [Hylobates moloch]
MKRRVAAGEARAWSAALRGGRALETGTDTPAPWIPLGHSHCVAEALRSPGGGAEMPLHQLGDKPLTFPSPNSAMENGLDHTPPSRRASPGTPLSPGSLCSAAHSPLDTSKQPLWQLWAEKRGARGTHEVRHVSSGQSVACGWWAFAPPCLQVLNTPKGVLFFLCTAAFLQGMTVNGFINTVITSLERRYDLHSYQSGLIASSYDIAACLCLTFVSYFGGSGHKPRWLGWGVLLMGTGSLVFALPHFTAGRYEVEVDAGVRTCPANPSAVCGDSTSGLSRYQLVFMLGQFLHGVGATPLYTLGVTYLDENVKSSYSPVYIAIFYTAAILGPAAGYLIGGALLNIYTEMGRRTELTTESPLWVGAWWVGFLGSGAAAFFTAVPILGYPRQLPGSQRYAVIRAAEMHQLKDGSRGEASNPDFGKTIRDLPLLLPEGHLNLTASCNAACGCQPEHYSPVCGSDGLMYFSLCHAGCPAATETNVDGQKVYRDCSCVPQNLSSGFGHATAGKCTSTCQRKPLLLVFIFVVIFFTFLSSIPALTATLRCVRDPQRSFALGIQWIVVRILGGIPGPIAFGWVIDKACLLWQDQCGQQGSCLVYQNSAMSRYILIMGLLYKVHEVDQRPHSHGRHSGHPGASTMKAKGVWRKSRLSRGLGRSQQAKEAKETTQRRPGQGRCVIRTPDAETCPSTNHLRRTWHPHVEPGKGHARRQRTGQSL